MPTREIRALENNQLYADALQFAGDAHAGQTRKYTGLPYIIHPVAVAAMLDAPPYHGDYIRMQRVTGALLHDTIEDTKITIEEIESKFGNDIATIVEALTDRQTPEDGNRAHRRKNYIIKIANAGDERISTIKWADLIDNAKSIQAHDPQFFKVYRDEIREYLPVLNNAIGWMFGYAKDLFLEKK